MMNKWRENQDNLRDRGINVTLVGPATNQILGLSLHTVASLVAKTIDRGWCDWRRLLGISQIAFDYARAQSEQIFGDVPFPDHAIDVGFED